MKLNRFLTILFFLFLINLLLGGIKVKAQTIPTLNDRINNLLSKMTLDEKILQLHRLGDFTTSTNIRLGIPGFKMADGPHGVREGMATSFPVGIGLAATWDTNLARRVGIAMGEEFYGKRENQALGPCLDLTRDPRDGRSPESGGEDPYLDAQITTSVIIGIQTNPVIATAKHYNGVFRQQNRTDNNYIISQRNLLEHYGLNFRNAVQIGGVMSVMNAYNLINGDKSGESINLLRNILKVKWGFPYYVVSDWCSLWDAQKAILAGCDLEMCSNLYETNLKNLVQNGLVPMSVIDESVKRVLRTKIINGMMDHYPVGDPSLVNSKDHQNLVLEAGEKSIVLLKNEGNILPLNKQIVKKIALIGPNADVLQIDGTGSSYVTPYYTVTPKTGIENIIGSEKVLYAKGCNISGSNASDIGAALQYAVEADAVIFVGGLDPSQEGEGLDRAGGSIELPKVQRDLINNLNKVNSNLIVVIFSGGICSVHPFVDKIKGLLYAFYPGQEGGNALAKILFGEFNPAGRLPVTMPISDAQLPDINFNFDDDYGGGYRWYDIQGLIPEFAFGTGMSYTTFAYSNLIITPDQTTIGKEVEVSCDLKNTGLTTGEEVVQLYLSTAEESIFMPVKQLKGFKRVLLQPNETKTLVFKLTANEFYYFDEGTDTYKVNPGNYIVKIGGASDNLPLEGTFTLESDNPKPDLVISGLKTIPPFPQVGDSVTFAASILNYGTGPCTDGIQYEVNFKVNGELVSKSTEFSDSILSGGMALVCSNSAVNGKNFWVVKDQNEFIVEAEVNPAGTIDELYTDNNSKSVHVKVYGAPLKNLALQTDVEVSSIEASGLEGANAVDGRMDTRWSSQFSDPQYLIIDLGIRELFNRIDLFWETAYGKEYKIYTSDNKIDWAELYHQINGTGGNESITKTANARYIKIAGIRRGTEYGYSLWEVQVYNDPNITSIKEDAIVNNVPSDYKLFNNYPNPFNPSTMIKYAIPAASNIKVLIHNILGQEVEEFDEGVKEAGYYNLIWESKNISSGIYFYTIIAESLNGKTGFQRTMKMMLLK